MECINCTKHFQQERKHQIFCSPRCRINYNCRKYFLKHRERELKRSKNRYIWEKENNYNNLRLRNQKAVEKKRFGELKKEIIKRFDGKCVYCKTGDNLLVHHLDNKGRKCEVPNNVVSNKVICCRSCHAKIHMLGQELKMKI